MELREQIRQWASWPGWRRHAPAAGSVAAHAVVGLALVTMMAAVSKPEARPAPPVPDAIEVSLLPEEIPEPEVRPAPARAAPRTVPSTPATDTAPALPPPRKDQKQQTAAPDPTPPDPNSVYVPRSPFASVGPTGGLNGLVNRDPCTALVGTKPKDCAANWAARVGAMDSVLPRSKEDMKQQYAEFITPCRFRVGCEPPADGKLNNGTRSFGLKSPMASGPGGVQGINELVGRLGFNPDHTDPGFGD